MGPQEFSIAVRDTFIVIQKGRFGNGQQDEKKDEKFHREEAMSHKPSGIPGLT
jgi:hypothetical protein